MATQRINWLVISAFGERWPWYKKWWHYLTRTGKAQYLWPWQRT